MKKVLGVAAGLLLFSFCALFGAALTRAQHPHHFTPPDVLYASDIPYSASTVAAGVDTLAVNVEADGNIINVQVLQDIPTLTSPALVAVHDWRYVPATLNGKHVPSTLLVHVAFDPPYLQLKNVPLAPVGPFQPLDPKAAPYTPPQLLAATFPPYPPEGRVGGAVVLDVHLDSGGGQSSATFLR